MPCPPRSLKRHPCAAYPVTVEYARDSTWHHYDFRRDIAVVNAMLLLCAIPSQEHSGKGTNSGDDRARVVPELPHGKIAKTRVQTLASPHADELTPHFAKHSGQSMSQSGLCEEPPRRSISTTFTTPQMISRTRFSTVLFLLEVTFSGMTNCLDFVLAQARCFAPEEVGTRHPQIGNCGAPGSTSMFTPVNFRCVNKIRLRCVTAISNDEVCLRQVAPERRIA